jgi:hypothetical protein
MLVSRPFRSIGQTAPATWMRRSPCFMAGMAAATRKGWAEWDEKLERPLSRVRILPQKGQKVFLVPPVASHVRPWPGANRRVRTYRSQ